MYIALIVVIPTFLAVMIAAPYVAAGADRRRSEASRRSGAAERS